MQVQVDSSISGVYAFGETPQAGALSALVLFEQDLRRELFQQLNVPSSILNGDSNYSSHWYYRGEAAFP